MKKLITLQHPQSLHHTNGMIGSWTDWDLSPLGVQQAETIAANLARELKGQVGGPVFLGPSPRTACGGNSGNPSGCALDLHNGPSGAESRRGRGPVRGMGTAAHPGLGEDHR